MTTLAPDIQETLLQVRGRKGLAYLALASKLSEEVVRRALHGLDVAPEAAKALTVWCRAFAEKVDSSQCCPECRSPPRTLHAEWCKKGIVSEQKQG
jgi:hypothetical protein